MGQLAFAERSVLFLSSLRHAHVPQFREQRRVFPESFANGTELEFSALNRLLSFSRIRATCIRATCPFKPKQFSCRLPVLSLSAPSSAAAQTHRALRRKSQRALSVRWKTDHQRFSYGKVGQFS